MAIKQLPKTMVFSFGLALCVLLIVTVGSMVLTNGEYHFGPSNARHVFTVAFLVLFVFFSIRALLRGKK